MAPSMLRAMQDGASQTTPLCRIKGRWPIFPAARKTKIPDH